MATVLVIVIALTLAIAFRNTRPGRTRTEALVVVVIAMAVRLVAIFVVFQLGRDNFPTGIWLNDEASFWRATEALLPVPWQGALPQGLDHLGGNGFLGLTSAVAMIGGLDPTSFRLVNVGFGSISALLALWLARHLFGRAAGLTAGIGVALWPTLVLWSATVLRDMLCGFVVLVAWWAVRTFAARDWLRMFCLLALALALLLSLRPYLAAVVFVGSAATVCWPAVRRLRWRWVGFGIVPLIAIGIAVSAQQATRIEQLAHSILYRQTVTRMETLGRLYRDPPPEPAAAGAAVVSGDGHCASRGTGERPAHRTYRRDGGARCGDRGPDRRHRTNRAHRSARSAREHTAHARAASVVGT